MHEDKKHYKIPLFDFDIEQPWTALETTTNDASEYVSVEHIETDDGDPELRTEIVTDEQQASYRFYIQNETLRSCAYRGQDLDEIPSHVQHAIAIEGYGIQGLCQADSLLMKWLDGNGILNCTAMFVDELERFSLLEFSLSLLRQQLSALTTMALAKFALPTTTYNECWLDTIKETEDIDSEFLLDLTDRFKAEIDDSDLSVLQPSEGDSSPLPLIFGYDQVQSDDDYLLVDLISPWAAHRFPFKITSDDACVYDGPADVHVPASVVNLLHNLGYELDDQPSIAAADTAAEVTKQHVAWAERLNDHDLLPEPLEQSQKNPIRQSKIDALGTSAILQFFEEAPSAAAELHDRMCDKHDITHVNDLSVDRLEVIITEMFELMPDGFHPWR